jgi:hypothetical protein
LARYSSAEEATQASICALARSGLEALSISEQHTGTCPFCEHEVDVLFLAAEEYLERPEAKLDLDSVDVADASNKQAAKAQSWGF